MYKKFQPQQSSGLGVGSSVGLGILGAAAGAALTYFLFETDMGNEKREKIVGWAKDTKDRTFKSVAELSAVTKEMAGDMTELIKDKYDDLKDLNKEQIGELANKIREHWAETRDDIENMLDENEGDK